MDPESTTTREAQPKPTLRRRFMNFWRRFGAWNSHIWNEIKPGPEARRGAIWGSLVVAFISAVIAGGYLHSGFGLLFDLLLCLVLGALLVLIAMGLVPLVLTVLRTLPRLATGVIVGAVLVVVLAFMPIGLGLGPIYILIAGVLGASIATFLSGFRGLPTKKKVVTVILFVLALAGVIREIYVVAHDGSMEGLVKAQMKSPAPDKLIAANPAEPGTFKIRVMTYGNKDGNRRRLEYNNPTVATPTVDASRFFKDFKGWKRSLRKTYWGYDMDKLPLNATVWLPQGPGPFPLVLIVHGNHNMAEFSDPGYRYLGELLASRGFILASVDENFLNGGLFDDPPKQQAVRGWMLIEHLKLWRQWSKEEKNPFGVAVDFDKIALMGHSRGGEAAATAALFNQMEHYPDDAAIRFDYHFPIRSIVAIAPADGQYKPAGQPRGLENVNYFTIQGANDADVSLFMGSCQWDRVKFAGDGEWFKSELYIYRANHGQFNTVWGRSDVGYPLGWFLNLKPLLNPNDQRQIAKIYISAFLEATLHDQHEYIPLFRDYRSIKTWLPDTLYVNRYQDSRFVTLADFNEDPDVSTTTLSGGRIEGVDLSIWREGRIPLRTKDREYNGVFLGWNRNNDDEKEDPKIKPIYAITLPDDLTSAPILTSDSALVFSLATLDEDAPLLNEEDAKNDDKKSKKKADKSDAKKEREAPDFTVELEMVDGRIVSQPLSNFGPLMPPLKTQFTKIKLIDDLFYEKPAEAVFQTITMPFAAFAKGTGFDASGLRMIRLRFDRTPKGVILLSKVGFAK